ncbi:MAG: Fic family protein [Gemmatimonadota bacterium]|nr:Fic family protein [Gemmatimonadota bacterium]
MKASDFSDDAPGQLAPTIEKALAFVPGPIPTDFGLEDSTIRRLARAAASVGRLQGMSSGSEFSPYLVSSPLLRREAILSSRIEGTITTPERLLLLEADERDSGGEQQTADHDTKEVANYVRAMEKGLDIIRQEPLTLSVIKKLHEILLTDVRGERDRPGEFRESQNWIGNRADPIGEARFVPPPPIQMHAALAALERYINQEQTEESTPLLIQLAFIHYQFEAIHPFRDGNGRIGRLMIPLLMCGHGRLDAPMLYMSSYFARHRDEYVDLLLAVSQRGSWTEWLNFFLLGVDTAAQEAVDRTVALVAKRQEYRGRFQAEGASARVIHLIDRLFHTPVISIKHAANVLDTSHQTAAYSVHKLEDAGVLREATGRSKNKLFVADAVVRFMYDNP